MIKENSKIKNFDLKISETKNIKIKQLLGKKVIIFFYPKDDTPGCTKEAISFSENLKEFEKYNSVIFGISKDSLKKHENFKLKHNIKVNLASDSGDICELFGVWVEKSMYGKKYMGIERSTFFIDENQIVKKIWRKVKVSGHVDEVLEVIKGS